MTTKAVAPGSLVANGLSEKAAQELGLNCGTKVGTSMIIVMMITNINVSNVITFRWGRV